MNYLAHIYLSSGDELLEIGNFMADGIRGKEIVGLHPQIRNGVVLHRAIDTFTDVHPLFRQGTKRLHGKYHHYAGVILDVFYDHFLARNWADYSDVPLRTFTDRFHDSLHRHYGLLNEKTRDMMPYMIRHDWLWNYQFVDGIERILSGMDRRAKHDARMRFSIAELQEHYEAFSSEFRLFFEDIRSFCQGKRAEL